MKKIIIFSTLAAMMVLFFACEKAETDPKVTLGAAALFTAPAQNSSYVLTAAEANNVMATFTWSAADFGYQAATTYKLQMDKAGNNFAEPTTLKSTTDLEFEITVADMNTVLLGMDLPTDRTTDLEFRVVAWINDAVESLTSDVLTLKIQPFEMVVKYPLLFVPGSYQGWNPGDSTTSIASVKSNGLYEGYIWFANDNTEFKYTQGPSWDVNWGDDGANGSMDPGGANIIAATAGYYKLNVDLNAFTHTYLRTEWGLIGSATPGGWDSDQNMTYNPDTKQWTITLDLAAGEIKFRANDGWDLNYGDTKADGKLDAGGDNIAVATAGNYTVTLDLGKPVYKYKLVKN